MFSKRFEWIYKSALLSNSTVIVSTQQCMRVWWCVVVPQGKVKSARHVLPPINPTPRSCPSRCRLSPHSKTCKHYWSPLSPSLSPIVSLTRSLNQHQKATEETRSQRSISALLIHSLPSRTQSSRDKSFDGKYLCRWGGRPYKKYLDGQQSLFISSFQNWKNIMLLWVFEEWLWCSGSTWLCPMGAVNEVSLSNISISRVGRKIDFKNKARAAHRFHTEVRVLITCTVGANPF